MDQSELREATIKLLQHVERIESQIDRLETCLRPQFEEQARLRWLEEGQRLDQERLSEERVRRVIWAEGEQKRLAEEHARRKLWVDKGQQKGYLRRVN